MKHLPSCVVLVLVLGSTLAIAQVVVDSASTVGESYARGAADIIRSQGQRNLDNSQAAINAQDAYSAAIDNSVKSVNAFWEKNDIYSQRVAQKNYEIGQQRDAYLAKHGLQSLTSAEFDRTTGQIAWPKVLLQPQYDEYRKTLDELCQKRAKYGALTSDDYMAATAASKGWRVMLAGQSGAYPAPILSQMVRFVLKVNREINDNLS